MTIYDALIVGAGPSGSSAAYKLANAGWNVLIVEKKVLPTNKHCGGAIPQRLPGILEFPFDEGLILSKIHKMRLKYGSEFCDVAMDSPYVYTVDREKFDSFLLKKAMDSGAEVIEECAFQSVHRADGLMIVNTNRGTFNCRNLIGADGAFSHVRKQEFDSFKKWALGYSIYAEIPKGAYFRDINNTIDIDFNAPKCGYGWAFDKGNKVSVGLVGSALSFAKPESRQETLNYIDKFTDGDPDIKLRAGFLPLGCTYWKKAAEDIFLVGDAGGFIDPFSGEGISYGIESGYLLADLLVSKKPQLYANAVKERFNARINGGLILLVLVHSFPFFFKKKFLRKSTLASYLRAVAGDATYYEFMPNLFR